MIPAFTRLYYHGQPAYYVEKRSGGRSFIVPRCACHGDKPRVIDNADLTVVLA